MDNNAAAAAKKSKNCTRCKKDIDDADLHKIVMYVVRDKFASHHYEHVECPHHFTV